MSRHTIDIPTASSLLVAAATILAAAHTASAALQWSASVLAHSDAHDPPAAASNPADLNQAQIIQNNGTVIYVPDAGSEANWNNDLLPGSWHTATSLPTKAQSKAKAGLDPDGVVVVDARARFVPENPGGDVTANAHADACMDGRFIVACVGGCGNTVVATLDTGIMLRGPDTISRAAFAPAYGGTDSTGVDLPVGIPFDLRFCDTADVSWPPPPTFVVSEVYVDDQLVYGGSATMSPSGSPQGSGDFSAISFFPWTGTSPFGNSYFDPESGLDTAYAGVIHTLSLPPGYTFEEVPPPPCPGDIDGDNDTDVLDFSIFAADFGCGT